MKNWIPPTEYQRELVELVKMMALNHPATITEEYILSELIDIKEEPYIWFESVGAIVDELYDAPPVEIIRKVKKIALLMDEYVLEIDFWENPDADPIDLMTKHFPPGWSKNKITEAALELASDPSIKEYKFPALQTVSEKNSCELCIEGTYEGVRMRFIINPYTQEIGYCDPLDGGGRFTSAKEVRELYG